MTPARPIDELARLGDEIYERDVRPKLEAEYHGAIVSIDVASGSWAVGDSILEAADRLRAQCPDATDVWSVRVGHRTLRRFGGRPLRGRATRVREARHR